jgi:hypothetical protein
VNSQSEARDQRALLLAENAGVDGTVTAEGGKPPCGVDGSGGVCELLCDLDDLLEAEAKLKEWAPRGFFLLGDVIRLADELARGREAENARRREQYLADRAKQKNSSRFSDQLTVWACASSGLAPSAG